MLASVCMAHLPKYRWLQAKSGTCLCDSQIPSQRCTSDLMNAAIGSRVCPPFSTSSPLAIGALPTDSVQSYVHVPHLLHLTTATLIGWFCSNLRHAITRLCSNQAR